MSSARDIETTIVSVKCVKEYSGHTPKVPYEIPDLQMDKKLAPAWQDQASKLLDPLSSRPGLVLKIVDLSIRIGECFGIVDRTDARKSSVTMVLFRMIKATKGKIVIDGVDTST
ncbi:hypothetical protein BGZ67_006017 [Mortierella alpina]|nr:hypothetical protein BGZ67_006017 [Mortierella alpina]